MMASFMTFSRYKRVATPMFEIMDPVCSRFKIVSKISQSSHQNGRILSSTYKV